MGRRKRAAALAQGCGRASRRGGHHGAPAREQRSGDVLQFGDVRRAIGAMPAVAADDERNGRAAQDGDAGIGRSARGGEPLGGDAVGGRQRRQHVLAGKPVMARRNDKIGRAQPVRGSVRIDRECPSAQVALQALERWDRSASRGDGDVGIGWGVGERVARIRWRERRKRGVKSARRDAADVRRQAQSLNDAERLRLMPGPTVGENADCRMQRKARDARSAPTPTLPRFAGEEVRSGPVRQTA